MSTPREQKFLSMAISNSGEIYLGGAKTGDTGGVFRSTNNGETWDFIGLEYHSFTV